MIPARISTNFLQSKRFTLQKHFQLWAGRKVFAHPSTIFKMLIARGLIACLGSVGWGVTGVVALSVFATGLLLGGEYAKHCNYVAFGVISGGFF